MVFTHLVPRITDVGIPPEAAAGVQSMIGVAAIAGGLLMGHVSDKMGRKVTPMACALLQVGAMLWLIWAQDLWMFYLFAIIFGFANSGLASSGGALVSDIFKLHNIGALFGLLAIAFGIGAAIGPLMGGLIFDVTGSYSIAFLIAALALLLSTALIGLVKREDVGSSGNSESSLSLPNSS